jgi:hypothetical protein
MGFASRAKLVVEGQRSRSLQADAVAPPPWKRDPVRSAARCMKR